jgi:hypothetical protein
MNRFVMRASSRGARTYSMSTRPLSKSLKLGCLTSLVGSYVLGCNAGLVFGAGLGSGKASFGNGIGSGQNGADTKPIGQSNALMVC